MSDLVGNLTTEDTDKLETARVAIVVATWLSQTNEPIAQRVEGEPIGLAD